MKKSIILSALLLLISVYTWADKSNLQAGKTYYISGDKINLRAGPSLNDSIVGTIKMGESVTLIEIGAAETPYVLVQYQDKNTKELKTAYVTSEKISEVRKDPPVATDTNTSGGKEYFAVQNLSTERMRVYERCTTSPSCPHKMVWETEFVVGRAEEGNDYMTKVGYYKVDQWKKFYEDGNSPPKYPSWYNKNYMMPPRAGADAKDWLDNDYLPYKESESRGAFGWYAAMVAPNASGQWIHGTYGWGSEGDRFIKYTRKVAINVFANPRSHGCTRLENRAVAYARDLLKPGSVVLRIYAKEGYRDPSLQAYQGVTPKVWDFILTKESSNYSSAANSVLSRGADNYELERGSYSVRPIPEAVKISDGGNFISRWRDRVKGASGNTYDIDPDEYRGVFLVDEGRFVDYRHPSSLRKGGFSDKLLPDFVVTTGSYKMP